MRRFLPLLLLPLFTFTSCFTSYQVERPEQGSTTQAHLIIYRKTIIGFVAGARIYDNGRFLGKVGVHRYISCWLPAGEHNLEIRYDCYNKSFFNVTMLPNKTYAFAFAPHFMDCGRPKVRRMDNTNALIKRKPPQINYFE
jgi:hypothetical protein